MPCQVLQCEACHCAHVPQVSGTVLGHDGGKDLASLCASHSSAGEPEKCVVLLLKQSLSCRPMSMITWFHFHSVPLCSNSVLWSSASVDRK